VTQVEDALEFLLQRGRVPEPGVLPVQRVPRRRVQAAFAGTGRRARHGPSEVRSRSVRETAAGRGRPRGSAQAGISCRAFWNRLACERSALARVSNQSAISSKPSSRAVLAMPGYMSVYSWVSPAMADFRLLPVSPKGRPVA